MGVFTNIIDALTTSADPAPLDHPLAVEVGEGIAPQPAPGPGSVYTPPPVADALAAAMGPPLNRGPIVDPACGAGALLVAMVRAAGTTAARVQRAARLIGCDVDPHALHRARIAIALACVELNPDVATAREIATNLDLRLADGLFEELPTAAAVIANPPFEQAADMVRRARAERGRIQARFQVCRGNWDLWCPFVERALDLARPGAPVGLLLPDKLLNAPYAGPCRARLADARPALVRLGRVTSAEIDLVQLVARGGGPPGSDASWVATQPDHLTPLRDLAEVINAATVAEAYQIADVLVERVRPAPGDLRLVTTGAIDPGEHHWGVRPQRYLKRRWQHPVLPAEALPKLAHRLARFRRPKIVLAGLSLRLEAVFDPDGDLLPAKSTLVLIPAAHVDPVRLTRVLNAPATTARWRASNEGLALSGGYLRVTRPGVSDVGLDWG